MLFRSPELRIDWQPSGAVHFTRRAWAKFQSPGVYATTVTQPGFFRRYLLEQLRPLVEEFGAAIARSQIDLMHKQSPNAKIPPQLEAAANQDAPTTFNYVTIFGGAALGLAFPIAIVLWMGGGPVKDEVARWEP